MAIDYSALLWLQVGYKTYEIKNRKDFFSLQIKGTQKPLIRLDIKHETHFDHTLSFGKIHGTVQIKGNTATVFTQEVYLGSNLIVIPSGFSSIAEFYLNQYRTDYGKYYITIYEPATQVVINPVTNQPVILGQEALKALEELELEYADKIIAELTDKITVNLISNLEANQQQIVNSVTQTNQTLNKIVPFLGGAI
jgi:hypothetical protein